jgi:hypothetical protein
VPLRLEPGDEYTHELGAESNFDVVVATDFQGDEKYHQSIRGTLASTAATASGPSAARS